MRTNRILFLGGVLLLLFIISPVCAVNPPNANFTANVTNVCVYDYIQFNDTSTSAGTISAWFWLFGDSQDSHIQDPVHYYDTPGTYNVSLWVQDEFGENTTVKYGYINVSDCYSADFTANETCHIGVPAFITLNGTCPEPAKSLWKLVPVSGWTYYNGSFGYEHPAATGEFDGTYSYEANATINFTGYNVYTVTHICNFGGLIGIKQTTKTDYITIGVNGTCCNCTTNCTDASRYIHTSDGGEAIVIVFGMIGALIAAPLIVRRRRKRGEEEP